MLGLVDWWYNPTASWIRSSIFLIEIDIVVYRNVREVDVIVKFGYLVKNGYLVGRTNTPPGRLIIQGSRVDFPYFGLDAGQTTCLINTLSPPFWFFIFDSYTVKPRKETSKRKCAKEHVPTNTRSLELARHRSLSRWFRGRALSPPSLRVVMDLKHWSSSL